MEKCRMDLQLNIPSRKIKNEMEKVVFRRFFRDPILMAADCVLFVCLRCDYETTILHFFRKKHGGEIFIWIWRKSILFMWKINDFGQVLANRDRLVLGNGKIDRLVGNTFRNDDDD